MNFRNWILQNFPLLEDDFDALTDYELFSKMCEFVMSYYKDNEEMKKEIEDLKNYIYNIDFQDEVNKKLDEMASDGTLENIVGHFIQNSALWTFDNVDDMKVGTNLINGSYAKTIGYYEKNDGGGAIYFIRDKEETDIENNGSIIFIHDNLVAEMITGGFVNVLTWGVKKEDETTQSNLNNLINYYRNGNISIYFPTGKYYLTKTIYLKQRTTIKGDGCSTIIEWHGANETFIFNIKRGNKFCSIHDIYIDGKNLAYGIHDCDLTGQGNRGIRTRIYNITMENMILGIRLDGMGSEVHNILMNGSGSNGSYTNINSMGLFINGTDNYINSVRIQLFYYGALIIGANNRLVTVKCCVNKIGCELRPGESGMYMIDLQENYRDNMIMKETIESTLLMNNQTAGFSDRYLNGSELQYSLLKMEKCRAINIIGTLGCRTKLGDGSCGNEKYAIYMDELTTNVNAEFSYIYPINEETAVLTKPIFYCFDTSSNKITVNNQLLTSDTPFNNASINSTWILATQSNISYENNIITTSYKDEVDIYSEQILLNFVLNNQDVPQVIELNTDKMVISKVRMGVAAPSHGSYAKHVPYGLEQMNFLNVKGGSKLKFTYIGDDALMEQYGDEINELIGFPVERISFQIFGYIENKSNVTTSIKVANIE